MPGTIRKDSIDEDHRVDVYCDLHRKVSSVKALSGVNKGRVIDKPRAIVLEDVRLRVGQAAVCKVRETGVRSVHAYARGRRSELCPQSVRDRPDAFRVRYNPHLRAEFFDDACGDALTQLALLAIEGKTAWAYANRFRSATPPNNHDPATAAA